MQGTRRVKTIKYIKTSTKFGECNEVMNKYEEFPNHSQLLQAII